jgi:ABC-type branched-subunit amino acid transport system substrate-binding protein
MVWGDYWILGLPADYSWAVVGSPDRKYLWILGRTAPLSPDQFAAQAFTGVYLLAYAIRDAGKVESAAIRDALAKLKDVDTILGKFSVAANREAVHTPVVQEVKDGKFAIFKV